MSLTAQRVPRGQVGCAQGACQVGILPGVWRIVEEGTQIWVDGKRTGGWVRLFITEGWRQDRTGVWLVTDRARRNADFMNGKRGSPRSASDLGYVRGWIPRLPARIVCPHCSTTQMLDAEVLGMSADPSSTRWCLEQGCVTMLTAGQGYLCDAHEALRPGWVPPPQRSRTRPRERVRD